MLHHAKNGAGTFGQQEIRAVMGGAMCPPTLRRELAEHYPNMELFVVFGCTENSPVSFATNMDCPKEVRETTCGYVQEGSHLIYVLRGFWTSTCERVDTFFRQGCGTTLGVQPRAILRKL